MSISVANVQEPRLFKKPTLVAGRDAVIDCVDMLGQTYAISSGPLRMIRLEDERYESIADPQAVVEAVRQMPGLRADLLTFAQRLADVSPRYPFHQEWDSIAALRVTTFEHWCRKQIKNTTRNMIRKSARLGVEVRQCSYDDEFVRGMTAIFNESPARQGRRFWHYGKDFPTIKRQFSRFLFREDLIGAYYHGELIGFAMIGRTATFGELVQIVARLEHRDKAVANALVAKAVEVCESRGLPYLVYGLWTDDALSSFKRHSGFEKIQLPRYYVPLTPLGRLALQTGLHRGWKSLLPADLVSLLKALRRRWYDAARY